jgi:3-oxoacyl-[acyl-carrier protein] reductase
VRRVALVTGGAKGIGRGVALRLAADGWHVAICYRTSAEEAAETASAIEAQGVEALAEPADVGDPAQAERLFARVAATLGAPDALVHAAGPYHKRDVLAETPEGWRAMLAGNLDSFFHCARLVAPAMIERGWGRIVAYSMANADRLAGMPSLAGHYVAKVGVLALVRTFARALAPHGITVNAVSPGYIDSGSAPPEELEAALPRIPAGRLGSVDDAVVATSFLISDEAAYVNGTSLVVSGGWGV